MRSTDLAKKKGILFVPISHQDRFYSFKKTEQIRFILNEFVQPI